MTGPLAAALRVLAAEGPAAARDRFLDRAEEWRRRRSFRPARNGARLAAPLLNVLGTPPARRLGGLQIQLLRRLAQEAGERAYALLHPERGGYRLEYRDGRRRHALDLPGPTVASALALEDAAFEAAVSRAAETSQATVVHVEGMANVPPASLLRLGRRGLGIILSLHDFALFCPRPDLLEQPRAAFCGYCRDPRRCHACLGRHWSVGPDFQRRYREAGAELLASARAVIYPSSYLRAKFLDLVPGLDPTVQRVIEPALPRPIATSGAPGERGAVRHVAFVGAVHVRKGALVFEEVLRRLGTADPHGIRWSVIGGGEPEIVRRLGRVPGVWVRGYYRAGTLPELLATQRVDLALLLSIVPESYGLTLDECHQAGVPVLAFDHGACAERVRARGGGILVPLAAGAAGVVAALRDVLASGPPPVPRVATATSPDTPDAARAHVRLYRELGALRESPGATGNTS